MSRLDSLSLGRLTHHRQTHDGVLITGELITGPLKKYVEMETQGTIPAMAHRLYEKVQQSEKKKSGIQLVELI